MSDPRNHPTALKELRDLQDAIYRDKVLQARKLTPEQRFDGGLEHTNFVMRFMLDGAMQQTGITDVREGWVEVLRRMERLCRARDHRFYTTEVPP
jgi:hypothetical protein